MDSKNIKKPNIQKTILRILAEKPAVSVVELSKKINPKGLKTNYALTRSLKGLRESGLIEKISSSQNDYIRLTSKGKNKLNCLKLEGEEALVPRTWDGFWRIIILDIPEERKNEREALRYLLKKANFTCVKNTVWISPLPYENLFTNIKKDLGLGTELMIIITDKLDSETNLAFLKAIKN
jgi:DNA-binding transcriptional regulator PaaX